MKTVVFYLGNFILDIYIMTSKLYGDIVSLPN